MCNIFQLEEKTSVSSVSVSPSGTPQEAQLVIEDSNQGYLSTFAVKFHYHILMVDLVTVKQTYNMSFIVYFASFSPVLF